MEVSSGLLCSSNSGCRTLCCFITLIVNRGMDVSSGICFKSAERGLICVPGVLRACRYAVYLCSKCVDPHKNGVLIMNQMCEEEKNRSDTSDFYGEQIHRGAGNQCIKCLTRARRITRDHRQRRVAVKGRFFSEGTKQKSLFLC